MKLVELLSNQRIIVQLVWSEQKIEFFSEILDKDDTSIYVTPYIHMGSELELNVTSDSGVICNIYTDNPVTNQRISWKGVELTTENRKGKIIYCLRTRGYNAVSKVDDRRHNERVEVKIDGYVYDGPNGETRVKIHDISDTGISFYAPAGFVPKSPQIVVTFTDNIGTKIYDVKVMCEVSRIRKEDNHNFIGCKLFGENKNYLIYELLKRLRSKNRNVTNEAENTDSSSEESSADESVVVDTEKSDVENEDNSKTDIS